jgi:hypothetical protein
VTDVGTVVRCAHDGLRCWWSQRACAQVTGIALQGKVEVGSTFMLGPWSALAVRARPGSGERSPCSEGGTFRSVLVKSIHVQRSPAKQLVAGQVPRAGRSCVCVSRAAAQAGSLALHRVDRELVRKARCSFERAAACVRG